jgi:hypothetical protein
MCSVADPTVTFALSAGSHGVVVVAALRVPEMCWLRVAGHLSIGRR